MILENVPQMNETNLLYVMKGKFLYLNTYVASHDTFYFFPYGFFPCTA